MADGFSRASGKLVACNVHVAPGLGNAMGSLYNASFTGTPLILTAGQQEQGHGLTEPVLYGPLVQMAEPLVKWAVEVTRLEDLPRIVRRAAKIATTPPTGPVFISLPGDILNAEAGIELGRSTRVDTRVKPSDEIAAGADRAHPQGGTARDHRRRRDRQERCVAGGGPVRRRRWAVRRINRRRRMARNSVRKPVLYGCAGAIQKIACDTLAPYDLIDRARRRSAADVGLQRDRSVAGRLSIVQVGLVDRDIAKNYGADIALKADVRETLRALVPALKAAGGGALETRAKAGIGCAGIEELGSQTQAAGRTDLETRAAPPRSIRTGWRL